MLAEPMRVVKRRGIGVVAWIGLEKDGAGNQAFSGRATHARVLPFVDFGMTVSKPEIGGSVMVTGGNISKFVTRNAYNCLHSPRGNNLHIADIKIAIVDAVWVLVQKDKEPGWFGDRA